jgi:GTPase SAR1 family protein
VELVIWDIYCQDDVQTMRASYLRGSSGCLIVVDGTRAITLDIALELRAVVHTTVGSVPIVLALNKMDLPEWQLGEDRVGRLAFEGLNVVRTSAKTGHGVGEAFTRLARMMFPHDKPRLRL